MLRVAAYARVSTDTSDQINSLENQVTYFKKYIVSNEEWEYKGVYVDEGISGTSINKRVGFQQMLQDGFEKKFDLLLTKEISRFARNTLDSIYYTRKLKDRGVGVIFLNDGINTLDADAELRLTIMASIAQEESRKTSVRVKWGQKRSMEQGVVFGRDLLGYKVRGGKLYIDLEEAEIVKSIFHMFVNDKKGVYTIAKELTKGRVPTALRNKQWQGNVILKILRNEKYCGDLMQKKTYTPNYLLHEKKVNTGQEEKVYHKNHHEPIIERELFDKAQKELHRRSRGIRIKDKHSNKYGFSGLMKCGICGASYVVRKKTGKNGVEYRYWKCYEQVKHGKEQVVNGVVCGCDNEGIPEGDLKELILELIRRLYLEEELVKELVRIISMKGDSDSLNGIGVYEKEKNAIGKRGERLLNLYLDEVISKEEYISQRKNMEIRLAYVNQQMVNIRGEKRDALSVNRNNGGDYEEKEDEEQVNKKQVNKEQVYEKLENNKLVSKEITEKEFVKNLVTDKTSNSKYRSLINIITGTQYSEMFVKNLIGNIIIYKNQINVNLKHMPESIIIKKSVD